MDDDIGSVLGTGCCLRPLDDHRRQTELHYSVDSIKRTVLLKVLLQKYFLVSIKRTVYLLENFKCFSIFQKISIKNTVRLIESTDYAQPKNTGTPPITRFSYTAEFYLTRFFLSQKPR